MLLAFLISEPLYGEGVLPISFFTGIIERLPLSRFNQFGFSGLLDLYFKPVSGRGCDHFNK